MKRHAFLIVSVCLLVLLNVVAWGAVVRADNNLLRVTFLNVGQGDAVFIESPSGIQMLVDGGRDALVLQALNEVMPFYDRSIDIVLATHPDTDHIGGLPHVYKSFEVRMSIDTGVESDTATYDFYESRKDAEGSVYVQAERGDIFDLGGGVSFVVLFPDRDVSGLDINDSSVIGMILYGDTAFMLTGDASKHIEDYVVSLDGESLQSEVLKLGHHGSKTSSSELFLSTVSPEYGVVSAGRDNSYGHPHREVVDAVTTHDATLITTMDGNVTFVSDGNSVFQK